MTLYEQIQRAVDFIENQLLNEEKAPVIEHAAIEAALSIRAFQDYFWKVTGLTYRDYLKKRRLSIASDKLLVSNKQVIEIAFEAGYQSHEAFSRAFQKEFTVSPQQFRVRRPRINCLEKIHLYKELYMGVIIKDLQDMKVVFFDGFQPDPEFTAKKKMEDWLNENSIPRKNVRILGHNIDADGNQENNPENTGYRFYVALDARYEHMCTGMIHSGRFAVTGIEGNFAEDPNGVFISEGWKNMSSMVTKKGYNIKENGRWFEEELEPEKAGNLRLDLYVELEH